jgi:hypothetical protein
MVGPKGLNRRITGCERGCLRALAVCVTSHFGRKSNNRGKIVILVKKNNRWKSSRITTINNTNRDFWLLICPRVGKPRRISEFLVRNFRNLILKFQNPKAVGHGKNHETACSWKVRFWPVTEIGLYGFFAKMAIVISVDHTIIVILEKTVKKRAPYKNSLLWGRNISLKWRR